MKAYIAITVMVVMAMGCAAKKPAATEPNEELDKVLAELKAEKAAKDKEIKKLEKELKSQLGYIKEIEEWNDELVAELKDKDKPEADKPAKAKAKKKEKEGFAKKEVKAQKELEQYLYSLSYQSSFSAASLPPPPPPPKPKFIGVTYVKPVCNFYIKFNGANVKDGVYFLAKINGQEVVWGSEALMPVATESGASVMASLLPPGANGYVCLDKAEGWHVQVRPYMFNGTKFAPSADWELVDTNFKAPNGITLKYYDGF